LESLTTYGFRGEALAAICSVSKLKITTKTEHDLVAATCDYDHHGNLVDSKPSANAQGTLIVASQLFYNVPVRKQYYSTAKTKKDELSKVEDLLLNFGLIHPQLHLSLHHNRSPVWQKSRAADFIANIHQVLGHSICSQMEFIKENSNVKFNRALNFLSDMFFIDFYLYIRHCHFL
jgi:DNA mismatch repair protein PMS1